MTNKQAIGALNRIRCIIREDSLEEQALVYAIEAIKEQGTNAGDIIYRKAEIEPEAISKWKKEFREYVDSLNIARDDWKGIIEYIDELPSAQPERPKGEWIHQSKFGRIECDQCGKVFRNSFAPKNFCPNCGANMRGEQE